MICDPTPDQTHAINAHMAQCKLQIIDHLQTNPSPFTLPFCITDHSVPTACILSQLALSEYPALSSISPASTCIDGSKWCKIRPPSASPSEAIGITLNSLHGFSPLPHPPPMRIVLSPFFLIRVHSPTSFVHFVTNVVKYIVAI